MSQSTETLTNVRREVIYTNQSYDNTLDKLYSSIGKLANAKWGSIAKEIKSYDKQAQEYFIAKVEETIGPHGFMIFNVRFCIHVFTIPFTDGNRNLTTEHGSLYLYLNIS
jgi:hypothetical protein